MSGILLKVIKLPLISQSLLLFVALCLTACASQQKKLADIQYYKNAINFMERKNYQVALETFNSIKTLYPLSPYIQAVELESISAHYALGEYEEAELLAQRFISFYPQADQKDFAYFMLGRSQYARGGILLDRFDRRDLSATKQAFASFQQLTDLFPTSPYVPEALAHLRHIRNIIAENELKTARYYYERYSYVATVNRCGDIIKNFPFSPIIPAALQLMADAYNKLGLKEQEELALQTLKTNFSLSQTEIN